MRSKSLLMFLSIFSISKTSYASQAHFLDNKDVIEASIAQEELTRITVLEDRILHVFGMTGNYVLETDESLGQIFIKPIHQKPLHLTFTTEKGLSQDLRLIPQNKFPEPLIFKESEEIKKNFDTSFISKEEIENLIKSCRENRIPLGYQSESISPHRGSYILKRSLKGKKLRCLCYEIINRTEECMTFSEPEIAKSLSLKSQLIVAILIPQKILNSGERTDIYVVTSH